jgi:hypothetical protein
MISTSCGAHSFLVRVFESRPHLKFFDLRGTGMSTVALTLRNAIDDGTQTRKDCFMSGDDTMGIFTMDYAVLVFFLLYFAWSLLAKKPYSRKHKKV